MSFTPSQVWKCAKCGAVNSARAGKCVDCRDSRTDEQIESQSRPESIQIPSASITLRPQKSKRGKRSDGYDSQLEADWAVVIAERYGKAWRHHGVTLQLPVKDKDGRIQFDKYTPDFVAWEMPIHLDWRITAYECKGDHPWRRAGVERFKRFAEQTPWARFVLVERENGQWRETVI